MKWKPKFGQKKLLILYIYFMTMLTVLKDTLENVSIRFEGLSHQYGHIMEDCES